MSNRKIVKSGNSSFVLSLPINWVRENGLGSGRIVDVNEDELGNLVISPVTEKKLEKKDIVVIKVDGKEHDTIKFELFSAYVRDSSSIIFEGKEIPIKAAKLLEKINSLIGLGVIEQSTNSITAKNFFSLDKELSPKVLLRKMDIVNRASFSLLGNFFNKNFAQEDFFELRKLHEQNKNLFTLIRKCILKLLENPNLMNSMQTNHIQINKERIFAQNLRNISLMLQVIGGSFLFLDAKSPEAKELKKYFMGIEKDYQRMINATENNSYELIYSLLNDFDKRTREIDNFVKSLSDPLAVRITTSFLTMYRNIKDYSIESST